MLDESGKTYKSNLLAAIVSVVLSLGAVILYVLYFGVPFSVQIIVIAICFAFLSWLCAMVGYDKIKMLIEQFKG